MIKNLVLRIICFGAIFALVSGGYLFFTNLGDVGKFFMSIPSMIGTLFTALPMNVFTLIGGIIVWEISATIFPRGKKENKQK